MTPEENLDKLIKKYSLSLMQTYDKRNRDLREETEERDKAVETEAETELETDAVSVFAEERETAANDEANTETINGETHSSKEEEEMTGTASFFATVRTGGGAYPVENAKIIIGREDTVVSFLVTDENGDTPKVTLPAYPESDSLSYETAKEVMYFADVYATGFQEKKNLPVSAVGGAEIVLNVELVPNEERME